MAFKGLSKVFKSSGLTKLWRPIDKAISEVDPLMANIDIGTRTRNEEAAKAQKTQATQREQATINAANLQAENLRRNLGVDLQTNNVATVEAGGTSLMLDDSTNARKRRNQSGASLSSTLGIRQ